VIVETTADVPDPTVYTSVFVVALGALCAKTLYVDAIYFILNILCSELLQYR